MTSDEKLLEATSQFFTLYGIDSAKDVNVLTRFLGSQNVFSIEDIRKIESAKKHFLAG